LRFSLPRYRIDQMMAINWKLLTPLSLAILIVTAVIAKLMDSSPAIVTDLALFIANLIVFVITLELMRRYAGRQRQQEGQKTAEPLIQRTGISA
jgi:NADH-quinone oxidoreductase subunit H